MAYIDLKQLRKVSAEFNEQWVAQGGQLTRYHCGVCKNVISIRQPNAADVYWQTITLCIHCGSVQVLEVHTTGQVEAWDADGNPVPQPPAPRAAS